MQKNKSFFKWYSTIIPLLILIISLAITYFGSKVINAPLKKFNFSTSLDKSIPVIPVFVIPYLLCFVYWTINYIYVHPIGKEKYYKYFTASFICIVISGLFFIFLPTTIKRPTIYASSNSILSQLMAGLYDVDTPVNLFPSIHCLLTWLCFISVRGDKNISIYYRILSFIYSIIIFISTVVLKQHFLVDIVAAIFIAELVYFICCKTNIHMFSMYICTKFNKKLKLE